MRSFLFVSASSPSGCVPFDVLNCRIAPDSVVELLLAMAQKAMRHTYTSRLKPEVKLTLVPLDIGNLLFITSL